MATQELEELDSVKRADDKNMYNNVFNDLVDIHKVLDDPEVFDSNPFDVNKFTPQESEGELEAEQQIENVYPNEM